jgi:hypothetical protein
MKKPNWLAELHDAELEKVHQMQEAQLAAGNMKNEVPGNVRHTPSVGISSKTPLSIDLLRSPLWQTPIPRSA